MGDKSIYKERQVNVIGNAKETEQVTVFNPNSGKNKNIGLGVYNLEVRENIPKMPRMSKKREQLTLVKSATAMTLSHALAYNIEEKKVKIAAEKSDRSRTDR